MNAAEKAMTLKALRVALAAADAAVERELDALREATGAKSFTTPLGGLTLTEPKPAIAFAPAGLLEWVRVNLPHEVQPAWVETVEHPESARATAEATLRGRCRIVAGDVVDTVTGEVLAFASVSQRAPFWTGRLTDEAKASAVETFLSQIDARLTEVTS